MSGAPSPSSEDMPEQAEATFNKRLQRPKAKQ